MSCPAGGEPASATRRPPREGATSCSNASTEPALGPYGRDRLISGVDLFSASPSEAAINRGDATRHDRRRSRQHIPTSLRAAAVDASLVRLTRQTAPHRATALGAGTLVRLDAVLASGARARCAAFRAVLVIGPECANRPTCDAHIQSFMKRPRSFMLAQEHANGRDPESEHRPGCRCQHDAVTNRMPALNPHHGDEGQDPRIAESTPQPDQSLTLPPALVGLSRA